MFKIKPRAKDIELVQTCGACPEQYDAIYNGKIVGYLRLRHGSFRVDVPDCGGETVYTASPKGDGAFYGDERDKYLHKAKKAIAKHIRNDSDGYRTNEQ